MSSRRKRTSQSGETRMKKGAKKQLSIMLIAVALMVFSLIQVYYLARYTFGYEVEEKHLRVYKWVSLLLN